MNEIQLLHHQEKAEAVRAEFQKLWIRELMPRLRGLGGMKSIKTMSACKDIAWHAFKAAKGLTP